MKRSKVVGFAIILSIMALTFPLTATAENSAIHYLTSMYDGSTVNTGKDNGFKGTTQIKNGDVHYAWSLGQFVLTGYTEVVKEESVPVFLVNPGDTISLTYKLDQNIDALNGKDSLFISNAYGRKYYDAENPNGFIIDVVLFAADDACVAKLNKYAEAEYHDLCDKYRVAFAYGGNQQYLKLYNDIVADSDEVSKHPMRLPETIGAFEDKDGKEYDNHLYVDDETGKAKIRLNTWEDAVLSEEMRRPDFVCWLRNQPRAKWALCLPYEKDGKMAGFYPDFLIIRRDPVLGYIVDVLEPHGQQYADNLPKAKALAQYGKDEPRIARLQLIHMDKDITGKSRLKRLDLAKNSVRGLVSQVQTVDELDHVFDIKGEF